MSYLHDIFYVRFGFYKPEVKVQLPVFKNVSAVNGYAYNKREQKRVYRHRKRVNHRFECIVFYKTNEIVNVPAKSRRRYESCGEQHYQHGFIVFVLKSVHIYILIYSRLKINIKSRKFGRKSADISFKRQILA